MSDFPSAADVPTGLYSKLLPPQVWGHGRAERAEGAIWFAKIPLKAVPTCLILLHIMMNM